MPAKDLSVLIPARNEVWLARTIRAVLEAAEADTEVIAVLDGCEPAGPLPDDPRVRILHYDKPIGQRGATNAAAQASTARYVMKADAHCAFDQGFDRKLMADYEPDQTVVPRMYRLHVFDWVCPKCSERYYQADPVPACKCGGTEFVIEEVWKPRWEKAPTDFARFDATLHFKYWRKYNRRPEAQADIADVMSFVGACWFMSRERYWDLEGLDEGHGFWGQVGTEVACKSWLSGGRLVVNKRTWFAHFFRVGKLKFPYHISGEAQERARIYSRDLWFNNRWHKQVRPLRWLVDKFSPVPDWEKHEWSAIAV